jgi:repressor LexA
MDSLTARQQEIYAFIGGFIRERGAAPSYEEIRRALGLRSLSTVHKHLKQLERRGWLHSPWESRKRALTLVAERPAGAATIPLLGTVAAGAPIEALEVPEETEVPESLLRGGECFGLRVRGDSMIEDGIHDGDLIIVKSQETADNGQTVVALVDGEATVKRFYRRDDAVELRPANAAMAPIVAAAGRVRVRGVVIGLVRQYK